MTQQFDASDLVNMLDSPERNRWIKLGDFAVYVRKAERLITQPGGQMTRARVVDIASVNNLTNGRERTGKFREMVGVVEMFASHRGFDGVFVESLLETQLVPVFVGLGYSITSPAFNAGPPSAYKLFRSV